MTVNFLNEWSRLINLLSFSCSYCGYEENQIAILYVAGFAARWVGQSDSSICKVVREEYYETGIYADDNTTFFRNGIFSLPTKIKIDNKIYFSTSQSYYYTSFVRFITIN